MAKRWDGMFCHRRMLDAHCSCFFSRSDQLTLCSVISWPRVYYYCLHGLCAYVAQLRIRSGRAEKNNQTPAPISAFWVRASALIKCLMNFSWGNHFGGRFQRITLSDLIWRETLKEIAFINHWRNHLESSGGQEVFLKHRMVYSLRTRTMIKCPAVFLAEIFPRAKD